MNAVIFANNREDMFVTVWVGILEVSTGRLTAANAGHEYPVLMNDSRQFALMKDDHGLVIGVFPQQKYKEYTLQLSPGAKLFVYTDGVIEATNSIGELFGITRMVETLNRNPDASPKQVLSGIRQAVDDFAQGAEQADDLTMLCLEFKGKS